MSRRRLTLGWLALALAVGCDDGGSSAEPGGGDAAPDGALDAAADARAADLAPPLDQAAPDAAPDAAVDGGSDAAVDMAPDQFIAECTAGDVRCAEPGRPARVVCEAGRWVLGACPEGQICLGEGACLPDPVACLDGDRICLDERTPAVCEPGERWQPARACPEGTACSGRGECRSVACAVGEANRSYLGCDYHAVELPNLAFAPIGATADAPLGVVLTNPDQVEAVRVTVRGPDGRLAALVPEVTIQPPAQALGQFEPVTVRSEIRSLDGVVSQGFDQAAALEVPPGGIATLLLPSEGLADRRGVRADAWRVSSDRPVAAYQFSPYCCNFSYTNDASLLLPTAALGTAYVFVGVPSWNTDRMDDDGNLQPFAGYPATLSIIGTQAGTRVRVTLPPAVDVAADPSGTTARNGQVLTAVLGDSEVWTLEAGEAVRQRGVWVGQDLTGARIEATAPVAVFSGHECTFYPSDQAACDHLEEQLFPLDAWGSRFLLAPPALRTEQPAFATETTYWKIVAQADDTRVTLGAAFNTLDASPPGSPGVPDCADALEGPDTLVLQAGEFCELGTRSPVAVTASAPVQIMGVMSGQASVGLSLNPFDQNAGDPAIWLAPPQRQFRREYAFLAPDTYFLDYVTVVAPEGTEISLDGAPVPLVGARPVPGTAFVVADLPIEDGPHRITGSAPFGILVYAYDDYVSYAFTGGLDLSKR